MRFKEKKDSEWAIYYEKKKKKKVQDNGKRTERKRNLNTVEHGILKTKKKERKERTFF